MGKLVMSLSAAITAFVLALTAGSVYAYRKMNAETKAVARQATSAPAATVEVAADPVATERPDISPQAAASIAAQFLGRTDVYSVELADWQGTQSFKVTFSSGDVVNVSMKGDVLASQLPPTPTLLTVTTGGGNHGGGGGGNSGSTSGGDGSGEGEHEGGGD